MQAAARAGSAGSDVLRGRCGGTRIPLVLLTLSPATPSHPKILQLYVTPLPPHPEAPQLLHRFGTGSCPPPLSFLGLERVNGSQTASCARVCSRKGCWLSWN